ncbi:MAG: dephospho-CoA kinase [Filomicrobium sp.]
MLIVGLTGSIGMGKSTAAAHFLEKGIAVFDADAAVHELYSGRAVSLIEDAFPGTTMNGSVDRQKLSAALIDNPEGFIKLEAIVHPLVREEEKKFLQDEAEKGAKIAVLEIPLLLETGADALVDVVIVVSAKEALQAERVLARPGMTQAKFEQIRSQQMSDSEKRKRADFVVDTSTSISQSQTELDSIIDKLQDRDGKAYQRHWA